MQLLCTIVLTALLGQVSQAMHETFQNDLRGGIAVDPASMQCSHITLSSETPIYFRSPGTYPYNYPNNHDSCWVVTSDVPDVEPRIHVTFSAIEALVGMGCYIADYVEIRDGDNHNSTLLLRWCGWGHPDFPFVASNDSLYVRFHTDSSISYGGFEMKAYVNETAHGIRSSLGAPVTFPPLGQLPGRGLLPGQGRGQFGPQPEGTAPPDPNQSFNNDENSRNSFNNNLRRNNLGASTSGKDTGMIVGIVLAVLLGISLMGVGIHVLTKCYTHKNRPPWNPLENVIIPNRQRREVFDNLDSVGAVGGARPGGGTGGTGGGAASGKYALPPPEVSVPTGFHPPPPPPLVTGAQPRGMLTYSATPQEHLRGGAVNPGFCPPDHAVSAPPVTTTPVGHPTCTTRTTTPVGHPTCTTRTTTPVGHPTCTTQTTTPVGHPTCATRTTTPVGHPTCATRTTTPVGHPTCTTRTTTPVGHPTCTTQTTTPVGHPTCATRTTTPVGHPTCTTQTTTPVGHPTCTTRTTTPVGHPTCTTPTTTPVGHPTCTTQTTTTTALAPEVQHDRAAVTDLYADQDIGTPRSNNEGAALEGARPGQLPSLGLSSPSALPPLTMAAAFSPTVAGLVPVPPVYTSNVSLPPSYEDVSYS